MWTSDNHKASTLPASWADMVGPREQQGSRGAGYVGTVQYSCSLSVAETILKYKYSNCLTDTETHKAKGGAKKAADKTQHPFLKKSPRKPG